MSVSEEWTKEELLEDGEESKVACPKCKRPNMIIWQEGNDIDGIISYLVCPNCRYEEKE